MKRDSTPGAGINACALNIRPCVNAQAKGVHASWRGDVLVC